MSAILQQVILVSLLSQIRNFLSPTHAPLDLSTEDIATIDAAGIVGPGGSFLRRALQRVAATILLGAVVFGISNYLGIEVL